jgi:hypothetical protein
MEFNTENTQSFELVAEFSTLLCATHSVEVTRSGVLKIDSEKIDHKNIEKELIKIFSTSEQHAKFFPLLKAFVPATRILDALKRAIRTVQISAKNSDIKSDIIRSFDFAHYRPIVSIDQKGDVSFINTKTKKVAKLSHANYEKYVPKEERKEPIFGVVGFNPYRPESIYLDTIDGQTVTYANTYSPPEWQLSRELTAAEAVSYSNVPVIIARFLTTLFPEARAREFVLDWLHFAVTKRCETYLVLNGSKGIGKGLFTDHLCKTLMGKDNHKLAAPGILETNFNAMLENCRMIVLDEIPINDSDKIAKLKKYINTDQAIERKGVDVGGTITTYNSFIITSNAVNDMKIEWDDRRFSVMDMTETKLDEKWNREDIDELVAAFNDMEVMRMFGYYLMYRQPQGDEFTVYRGEHFWKLCYASLPEWCKTIIDEVTSGKHEILIDEIIRAEYTRRNPQGRLPHAIKIEDFIKNYRHKGKDSLGEFYRTEDGGFEIRVSDSFFKGRDNLGIAWQDAGDLL